MERKWFCELCKMCVQYTKLSINDHIRSQRHQKNKTKDLDSKHMAAKMKNLTQEEKYQHQLKQKSQVGSVVEMESMVDHIKNMSKIVGGNDFESQHKNFLLKKQQQWNIDNGYQQESEIVPNKVKQNKIIQPIEALSNSQLIQNTLTNVWVLMKDNDTGKMCFFNKISKVKKFEKPFGLKISNEDQRIWEESLENQGVFPEFQPQEPDQIGIIGQWKETKEDFYEKYKAVDSEKSDQDDQEEQTIKEAQFIIFGDQEETKMDVVDQMMVYEKLIKNQSQDQETTKNEVLKKMIEQEFDIENNFKKVYQQVNKKSEEPTIFKKRIIQKKKLDINDD